VITCPHCGSQGLFKRRLRSVTDIIIRSDGTIPNDAEAEEVPGETFVETTICCGCGRDF
jgi:hypothetical protein